MSSNPDADHISVGAGMAFDHTNMDTHPMVAVLARHCADTIIRKGGKGVLVDYGSGTGNVSLALKDVATKVIGIDISQGMVDVYNKKVSEQLPSGPPMKAVLLPDNVERLPSIIGKDVDCAFSCLVFHHVPNPTQILSTLASSVKSGGKIFIIDLMPMSREMNDYISSEMGQLRKESEERLMKEGRQVDDGEAHGHGHSHAHGNGHGHDHGKGERADEHSNAFSHFLGYTEDTVRRWFNFATPEMKDFFYEKAFTCPFTKPDGRPVDFFVAGMTKV